MQPDEVLRRTDWSVPAELLEQAPVGYLGLQESSLLYHLAQQYCRGRGAIVDAGSYLGRSAWFLGRGAEANPHLRDAGAVRIHCIDNFRVNDVQTAEHVEREYGRRLALGASTRAIFDTNTQGIRDRLIVHEGDFHGFTWTGGPIELLLVDIAKSPALNARVLEQLFPALIPGTSLVVQQDYHHPWQPHLHVAMQVLGECFALELPRVDDSAVFRLLRPIPPELLREAARLDLPADRQLALMAAAVAQLPAGSRVYVELAECVLLVHHGRLDAARERVGDVLANGVPLHAGEPNWERYANGVSDFVDLQVGWREHLAGRSEQALAQLERPLRAGRLSEWLVELQVHALLGLGSPDAADSALAALLADGHHCSREPLLRGWIALHRGDTAGAVELAARQVRQTPAEPQVIVHAMMLCQRAWEASRAFASARELMTQLEAVAPEQPFLWLTSAWVSQQLGDLPAARTAVTRARAAAQDSDARRLVESLPRAWGIDPG